jgi:hypothetical protein
MDKEKLMHSGYSKVDIPMAIESYESLDKSVAFDDSSKFSSDPDLMHIKFVLCHEGANANGDYFTKEVLQKAQATPKFKPVDWEHGQPMIGTMLDSYYKEESTGRGFIEAIGVVWKFLYPELSEQIKKKSATGELKLSMECWYKDANYMVGDNIYDQDTAKDMGIIQYVGREYLGQKVYRVFKEVVFGGVGVVANPADKEAVFLSVAKDLKSRGLDIDVDNVGQESIDEILQIVAESIKRPVNNFNNKKKDEVEKNSIAIAKYLKAFDKAKSTIVGKFNKNQIQTKEQLLVEVNDIVKTFVAEINNISNEYYIGLASEGDSSELSTASLSFSEIEISISNKLFNHYFGFSESLEAYLKQVHEEYFIYELVDYSESYPDSVKLFKGFYSIESDKVVIHFEKAVEVEVIYREKSQENIEGSEESIMAKETKVEATEVVTEEVIESVEATEVVEEEIVEEVKAEAEAVEEKVVEEVKAEATEMEQQVASLKGEIEVLSKELTETKEAHASLVEENSALKSQLQEIEAEKVLASRLSEIQELGISFSETRLEKEIAKIKSMDAESFVDYKELLSEIAGKKQETVVEDKVEASEEVVEEEVIEVEGVDNASAGINIEQEVKKEVKPFGHLAG